MDATPFLEFADGSSREQASLLRRWKLVAASTSAIATCLLLVVATLVANNSQSSASEMLLLKTGAVSNCAPPSAAGGHDTSYPAFPPARLFPPSPPQTIVPPTEGEKDIAIIVWTRHGERSADKDDIHLTPEGYERARYMNKCIDRKPSAAFPLGAPTRLLASVRDDSVRPTESLIHIAEKLDVKLETADMMDIYAVNEVVPTLKPRDTLLVSWQHFFLPRMMKAMYPPSPIYLRGFPDACPTTEWVEPQYTRETNGGDCYDIVWQMVLTRPKDDASAPWQAVTFNQMHMGFAGTVESPCAEAFAPIDI